jgi:Guanylate-binding protein, N-terminal domain
MNNPLDKKREWIGRPDEPLTGFSWKSGSQRHTTGVVIWSDVFLHDTEDEKMAIVLMDTQGLFDTKTSAADNSRIFALGTLISSTQIFNLNDVIQEDQLEYLQMATDYARYASSENIGKKKSNAKPFQNLLFLMRDWSHEHDFDYGNTGGALYLADVLNIKSDQSPDLQAVRKYIKSSFDSVHCFLMPHPGFKILKNPNYDGRWSDLEPAFKDNLEDLLEWLFSPKYLKVKRVLGSEVTGKTFNEFVKKYFEIFQSPDTPQMPSVYQLIIQKQLENFLDDSLEAYKVDLRVYEDVSKPNFIELLEDGHEKARSTAMLYYMSRKKMGSEEDDSKYEQLLGKEIDAYYKQRKENLISTHDRILEVEVKKQNEISLLQQEAEQKIKEQTEALEVEKKRLEDEMAENQRKAEQNMQLLEEEKQAEIARVKAENEERRKKAEDDRQKLIQEHQAERERIQKEAEERTKSAKEEIERLQSAENNNQREMELKLQADREERMLIMKHEMEEKKEQRRMEQERIDREAQM